MTPLYALLAGVAAGGFWLTVHVHNRWERRKILMRHAEPCRRCGARN